VLHELVARHAQSMLAELRDADPDGGGLPRYVERELAAYLRCGILAHGFTRVRCQTCHDKSVVAFSCKRRGLCPSCTSRRMAHTAAHLVDRVLPSGGGVVADYTVGIVIVLVQLAIAGRVTSREQHV
jgi:hypothetical protein